VETTPFHAEIDLHTHTYFSDGRASPAELVEQAAAQGVRTLAITDHDNARAAREVRPLAARLGVELIPAVELTCHWDASGAPPYDSDIDLLGYYIDIDGPAFLETERAGLADMQRRIEQWCRILTSAGYPVTLADVLVQNPRYAGTMPLVDTLVRLERVRDFREGLRLLDAHRDTAPVCSLAIEEAIAALHAAGGVAVLAHPSLVRWRGGWLDGKAIGRLAAMGLQGVEIYHHRLDAAARAHFLRLARQHDLLITGGSDEHGWPDGLRHLGSQPVTRQMVAALAERRAGSARLPGAT
jgi:predicted metal-dependent phosphoesterase TrpH